MWLLCFLGLIVIQDINSLKSVSTGSSASLDNIIDEIANNIKTKGKDMGLDSFSLPDIYKKIKQDSGSSQVFNLTNGVVRNLTSIERYGSSVISYDSKILNVNVGFHFTDLQVDYDFNIHAWKLNPIGNLKGGLNEFRIEAEGNFDLNRFTANLSKLEIPTTGSISFLVNTTVPIYGYIVQDLFNTITPFQDIIIYTLGKELTNHINDILNNLSALRIN